MSRRNKRIVNAFFQTKVEFKDIQKGTVCKARGDFPWEIVGREVERRGILNYFRDILWNRSKELIAGEIYARYACAVFKSKREPALETHIRKSDVQDPILIRMPTFHPQKGTDESFGSVLKVPWRVQVTTSVYKRIFYALQASNISVGAIAQTTAKQ